MPTAINRIPDSPPVILSLPAGINRPLWSIMIPIYNGAIYLREAIESVLIQDMGIDKMQIEVVDDCSTDADVKGIVEEVGKGRVSYYRQEQNIGSLRNFETCINRSKGYYIHLLHCDDKVKDGFYETMTTLFTSFPEAAAAFCAHDSIDAVGKVYSISEPEANEPCILPDLLFTLAVRQPIQYVSMVVKREIYEALGAFYGVTYGEDWEMWARIAAHRHSVDVHGKVLKGSMFIVLDESLDPSRARHFVAGNTFVVPANAWHIEWWDEESVLEAEGVGPMVTTYRE